jgi:hypothetical protein
MCMLYRRVKFMTTITDDAHLHNAMSNHTEIVLYASYTDVIHLTHKPSKHR